MRAEQSILDFREGSSEMVRAWLDELEGRSPGHDAPLLKSYESLALALLSGEGPSVAAEGAESDLGPELRRALAEVAGSVRRSGRTISGTLEDLGLLTPVVIAWAGRRVAESEEQHVMLERTTNMVVALHDASRRVARILEGSARRAQRERSETLAAMTDQLSHELRNRLGAARTASDMLVNPDIELDEEGLQHAAELVRLSIAAALRTVGDVRALFASRSNPEEPPTTRPVSLARLVRSVIEDVTPHALDAGVEVTVEGDMPDCEVDAARMRLIVFNLVGNGIKYRDPDEARALVWLEAFRRDDGRLELRVQDNGIGIAPDDREQIFTYRYRGSGSNANDPPGSGLGLAIVREAVDQIGGEISVVSDVGVGTTFSLTFAPLSWEDEPPA